MPIECKVVKTPKGHSAIQLVASGLVTEEDALGYQAEQAPGKPGHGLPVFAIVKDGTEFTLDARKRFSNLGNNDVDSPAAVVMTSPALRVVINFMVKAINLTRARPTNVKFFAEEASAMAWLDEQIDVSQSPAARSA